MPGTITWIEDDAHIIGSVIHLLEDMGFTFEKYSSVKDALDNISKIEQSQLIILDVILHPGMDSQGDIQKAGVDLLRELRSKGIEIPVISLSVVTSQVIAAELKSLGVRAILNKPVLPSMLASTVLSILEDR
jgi:CheY-like chemotaxis protein